MGVFGEFGCRVKCDGHETSRRGTVLTLPLRRARIRLVICPPLNLRGVGAVHIPTAFVAHDDDHPEDEYPAMTPQNQFQPQLHTHTQVPRLGERTPDITGAEIVAELVPPPQFEHASFASYRPDHDYPSQLGAVER